MDGHAQVGQVHRLGTAAGEFFDVVGQHQLAGNGALRVVVALDEKDLDVGTAQAHHLGAEEQTRVEVGPVAVVQVACQQHEVHTLGQGQVDQVFQSPAGGVAQALYRRTGIAAQATQRAVDVQVGGVKETERAGGGRWRGYYVIHSS